MIQSLTPLFSLPLVGAFFIFVLPLCVTLDKLTVAFFFYAIEQFLSQRSQVFNNKRVFEAFAVFKCRSIKGNFFFVGNKVRNNWSCFCCRLLFS